MKLISGVIILIDFLGLLAYTDPKLEAYHQFISQQISKETRKAGPAG